MIYVCYIFLNVNMNIWKRWIQTENLYMWKLSVYHIFVKQISINLLQTIILIILEALNDAK